MNLGYPRWALPGGQLADDPRVTQTRALVELYARVLEAIRDGIEFSELDVPVKMKPLVVSFWQKVSRADVDLSGVDMKQVRHDLFLTLLSDETPYVYRESREFLKLLDEDSPYPEELRETAALATKGWTGRSEWIEYWTRIREERVQNELNSGTERTDEFGVGIPFPKTASSVEDVWALLIDPTPEEAQFMLDWTSWGDIEDAGEAIGALVEYLDGSRPPDEWMLGEMLDLFLTWDGSGRTLGIHTDMTERPVLSQILSFFDRNYGKKPWYTGRYLIGAYVEALRGAPFKECHEMGYAAWRVGYASAIRGVDVSRGVKVYLGKGTPRTRWVPWRVINALASVWVKEVDDEGKEHYVRALKTYPLIMGEDC